MARSEFFRPFEVIEGNRKKGMVLIADHAGRALPDEYGSLSLPAREFDRHIAYDIGVEGLTRELATMTGAPAVMANFSRLLIDPNRGEDDPTMIRQLYDGTVIQANYPMTEKERKKRLNDFYRPYHDAVGSVIASVFEATGQAPFIVSLHSFTPEMQGRKRPWHVGILWDMDDRAPKPMMEMLAADKNIVVGDNEPYDGALRGDTMYRHAIVNGYAHALIEVRQDLIGEATGVRAWAERLHPIIEELNRKPDMHVVKQFGSRTGPILGEENG
ncbi:MULTISPECIES: N-formylglutamate amidohydrolase [Mesorhizobium]|uniref:N-formylglutamate amidohydrolase n=1 Tax=Mesorhizobium denitrificans TaxID=2294114 RepID=A0A371XEW4_9HYPH|nr:MULTISPECIES: N-formylglutamate amidohydrolase [Mesorhizobium]RFC67777.1 N-formylglutamate amidohydrolase [Mesorhizobium denitrificans]